jgi:hypothetical protein
MPDIDVDAVIARLLPQVLADRAGRWPQFYPVASAAPLGVNLSACGAVL